MYNLDFCHFNENINSKPNWKILAKTVIQAPQGLSLPDIVTVLYHCCAHSTFECVCVSEKGCSRLLSHNGPFTAFIPLLKTPLSVGHLFICNIFFLITAEKCISAFSSSWWMSLKWFESELFQRNMAKNGIPKETVQSRSSNTGVHKKSHRCFES